MLDKAVIQATASLLFGPFCLDPATERLKCGTEEISLAPKGFAVLCYLVQRTDRLVTKEELLAAVWPDTVVGEAVLKVAIRDIRKALQDDPRQPRFIETVHRRGYRFIGKTHGRQDAVRAQRRAQQNTAEQQFQSLSSHLHPPSFGFVGREAEVAQLRRAFTRVQAGERQVIFVVGEAGIGKTALVNSCIDQLAAQHPVRIARGQCVDQLGMGEAYLPVLEAISRLCRAAGQEHIVSIFRQHAPTWLRQMPALLSLDDRQALQRETVGMTHERMLREMVEALTVLAVETPLVLILEDIHWSDYSTLDLIGSLAHHRETTKLLVIATYRPAEIIVSDHPLKALKQQLKLHQRCTELSLEMLTENDVAEYVAARFTGLQRARLQQFAHDIHHRTNGHPLFLTSLVTYLIDRGEVVGEVVEQDGEWLLEETWNEVSLGIPDSLQRLVTQQIEQLSPEIQRLLEAASVAGVQFTTVEVAIALGIDNQQIEEQCESLAQRDHFIRLLEAADWPDGSIVARYTFTHVLYQEIIYQRVAAGRRLRFHRQIGECLEQVYSDRTHEIAVDLAIHFEHGRDLRRAVTYLHQAATGGLQRYAYREAIGHLRKALSFLETLPESPECAQQEIVLQIALGAALTALSGTAVPEVEQAYARASALCHRLRLEDTGVGRPELFPSLWGLFVSSIMRGKLAVADELAEQLLRIAQHSTDPTLLPQAHYALGMSLYRRGEFVQARDHLEHSLMLYRRHTVVSPSSGQGASHPQLGPLSFLAWTLWQLGYPDQALAKSQHALALALEGTDPFSLAFVLNFLAWLHQLRREPEAAHIRASAAITLADAHELAQMKALGTIIQGWTHTEKAHADTRLAQLSQGILAWQATGAEDGRPYFLELLAESYADSHQPQKALELLDEALTAVDENGERYYTAELHRLKGEALLPMTNARRRATPKTDVLPELASVKTAKKAKREKRAKP